MTDDIDWSVTTWEGNRRRQHQEFYKLSLADKIAALEEMENLTRWLHQGRDLRTTRGASNTRDPR